MAERSRGLASIFRRGGISAAAERARPSGSTTTGPARLRGGKAERAWAYYETVGEVKYACQFTARTLGRLKVYVAVRDPSDPDADPMPATREMGPDFAAAIDAWDLVRDPNGGRRSLQTKYAQNMFIAGEGWLLCTFADDASERWEFLSMSELSETDKGYRRTRRSDGKPTELLSVPDAGIPVGDDPTRFAVAYRVWHPHPRWSDEPDAPMFGVLDIAEELLVLTLAIRSEGRSRIARSGVWIVPDEALPEIPEPTDGDPVPDDPFAEDFEAHATVPLAQDGSAEDVVPMIQRVPAAYASRDQWPWIRFYDDAASYREAQLRDEAVRRLAVSLDMPPETLLGKAKTNHWTAWQITEDEWRHCEPVADQMVDDFTVAYLRTSLADAGVRDPERFILAYDETNVVGSPDRGKDAKDAHDRGVISDKALRAATGFGDADAPGPGDPNSNPAVAGAAAMDPAAAPPGDVSQGDQAPPEQAASGAGLVVDGATRAAFYECRRRAGARIRSRVNGAYDGVPNHALAARIGQTGVNRLDARFNSLRLVEGGAESLRAALRGVASEEDVGALASNVELYAAQTLFDEDPAPPRPR